MRGRKHASEEARQAAVRDSQRRYREAHRERVCAAQRAYLARHPERRSATLDAAWRKLRADPERYARFLAQGRASYARNPLTSYLYALNWRGENRERVRANNREAGARRRALVGAPRREVNEYAIALRHDPCSYCGGSGGVVDHIEPLVGGGAHSADNLTGACRICNARKRARPLITFLLALRQQTTATREAA